MLQHSPVSQLPLEIFVDIMTLVAEARPASAYTNAELPRRRKARPNELFACMRVCRTWRQLILSTPRFWTTLSIDGVINSKNAVRKAAWIAHRADGGLPPAAGGTPRSLPLFAQSGAGGVKRLVLTAAQELSDLAFEGILATIQSPEATCNLEEVVCSFVDGARTTMTVQAEAKRSARLISFLHASSRGSLRLLAICTGGRIYPDFDLASLFAAFPRLETLNLRGSALSPFVVGINATFLRPSLASLATSDRPDDPSSLPSAADDRPGSSTTAPWRAKSLAITGAVFVSDSPCEVASFPRLEHLELDVVGAGTTWDLLSAPKLRTYRALLYGETHVAELPMPDLAQAWSRVEDIRLGGAKRFASRLLQEAIRLGPLRFDHLRSVDLSFASLSNDQLSLLFESVNAPVLENLVLASTTAVPPETRLVLPRQLLALKRLNISHTAWATDQTVRDLISSAPRLEALEIRGNVNLSGRPLMELVRARMAAPADQGDALAEEGSLIVYSELTTLALEGCTKIETPAVEWLKKHVRPGGVKFQFVDPNERRSSSCY